MTVSRLRAVPQRAAFDRVWSAEPQPEAHPAAVTVAVSLFNYERFLPPCLDSVATQTHPHLELIVVDDASTRDDSVEAAQAWMEAHAGRFDRAVLLRHQRNRGLATTRNTAFALARTDYVFVLDADNTIYPPAIERLHAAASQGSFDAAYSQLEFFGDRTGLGLADVWSRRRLSRATYIDAMALVRHRSWQAVGGYDHIESGWEDHDFWCKFAERGMTGLFVPEVLCRYRVHGSSMTQTNTAGALLKVCTELTARHPWLRLPL